MVLWAQWLALLTVNQGVASSSLAGTAKSDVIS